MQENLKEDQINRLWEYRLHIDNEYYGRLNFFLVFESVLLGVVGILFTRPNPPILILRVIVFLGLSITLVWGYIQARHKYILDYLNIICRRSIPEYNDYLEGIAQGKWPPVSSMWLLTYIIPCLVVLIWLFFLFFL